MVAEIIAPVLLGAPDISLPYVAGVTLFEGVPKSMRFFIHDRVRGDLIIAGFSNSDGEFKKYMPDEYVIDRQCFIVTFDDTGTYNAQISDLINAVT